MPYSNYSPDSLGIPVGNFDSDTVMAKTNASAAMSDAIAAGDSKAYADALDKYKALSGGAPPIWAQNSGDIAATLAANGGTAQRAMDAPTQQSAFGGGRTQRNPGLPSYSNYSPDSLGIPQDTFDSGVIAARTKASAEMNDALAIGDSTAYAKALAAYKSASGGNVPMWAQNQGDIDATLAANAGRVARANGGAPAGGSPSSVTGGGGTTTTPPSTTGGTSGVTGQPSGTGTRIGGGGSTTTPPVSTGGGATTGGGTTGGGGRPPLPRSPQWTSGVAPRLNYATRDAGTLGDRYNPLDTGNRWRGVVGSSPQPLSDSAPIEQQPESYATIDPVIQDSQSYRTVTSRASDNGSGGNESTTDIVPSSGGGTGSTAQGRNYIGPYPGGYNIEGTGGVGAATPGEQFIPGDFIGIGTADEPKDVINRDRYFAYQRGQELMQEDSQLAFDQRERARALASAGDTQYQKLLENPGYSSAQNEAILGQDRLNNLQLGPEDYAQNFITENEAMGIYGNPNAGMEFLTGTGQYVGQDGFDNSRITAMQNALSHGQDMVQARHDDTQNALNDATQTERNDYTSAIDPSKLASSADWRQYQNDELNYSDDQASGYVDPRYLTASDQYLQAHQFGPQDEQDMIQAAARQSGIRSQAINDQLERQAAAAGTNAPLALAAAQARQRQTGDVASADAALQARIAARQLGLNTAQQTEQTRLGAEQNYANLGSNLAMQQGTRRLAAAQAAEEARRAGEQDISTRQMQAAQQLGNTAVQNAQYMGSARAATEQATSNAQQALEQNITNTGIQLAQQGDLNATQRAQALAQNRQQVNQNNQTAQFQRGSYADTAASQRNQGIAETQRQDLNAVRSDIRQQQGQAQNQENSYNALRNNAFGTVVGATPASASNAIAAAKIPSTWEKLGNMAVGAAGAAAGAFAKGGVVTKPTLAMVGEHGPEMVVKLQPRVQLRPPNRPRMMAYQRRSQYEYPAA